MMILNIVLIVPRWGKGEYNTFLSNSVVTVHQRKKAKKRSDKGTTALLLNVWYRDWIKTYVNKLWRLLLVERCFKRCKAVSQGAFYSSRLSSVLCSLEKWWIMSLIYWAITKEKALNIKYCWTHTQWIDRLRFVMIIFSMIVDFCSKKIHSRNIMDFGMKSAISN